MIEERSTNMYQPNIGSGWKWIFWLVIIIMFVVFALGFNVKEATWLNPSVSIAEAARMQQETSIAQKNAELDYQLRKTQIDAQIEGEKQAAAHKAAQLQLELKAQEAKNIQDAQLRNSFQYAVNIGTVVFYTGIALALLIVCVVGSIGLYQILKSKAELVRAKSVPAQISDPWASPQYRRQARLAARHTELRKIRNKIAIKGTSPFWPDDGKAEELILGKYPWAI
jgi:hypothetical protein